MLIAVTEQWVLTLPTQNHFIVEGTLSGFGGLCSVVYTHSSHVCLLSTHMEVMFAYLPYLSMLTHSCLTQLCALYKSKTNKLQVLFAAVGGWTHFGEIQIKRFIYHPTSNISHGCSVRVLRFITSTSSYLHRQN